MQDGRWFRLLLWLVIVLAALIGIGHLLRTSDEAREVAGTAIWNLFTFFTTPFVLEFTVALVSLMLVVTYNNWQRHKDGPEWVEMDVPVDESASSTKPKENDA